MGSVALLRQTLYDARWQVDAQAALAKKPAQRRLELLVTFCSGAAADFSGSTNPLAQKMENRIILSRYLTAVQCVGDVPPQESGLTCNTWYGKHHTEMAWWHIAHFVLWSEPAMAKRNLDWFLTQLPNAQALAASRGLKGARWAKMVGPDGRESPGGNPFIFWNQPHPIYLADLLLRQSPSQENLEKYRPLVFETADAMVAMLKWDAKRGQYVLGPPLWIAQEIHDQATSQNPAYELAYWRWAIETAQRWRVRSGLGREAHWDEVVAKMSPLPVFEGKYTRTESHPTPGPTSRAGHDHPELPDAVWLSPRRTRRRPRDDGPHITRPCSGVDTGTPRSGAGLSHGRDDRGAAWPSGRGGRDPAARRTEQPLSPQWPLPARQRQRAQEPVRRTDRDRGLSSCEWLVPRGGGADDRRLGRMHGRVPGDSKGRDVGGAGGRTSRDCREGRTSSLGMLKPCNLEIRIVKTGVRPWPPVGLESQPALSAP